MPSINPDESAQHDKASSSPYDVPTSYSSVAGTASLSFVAAPLLAGGALAFVGVVIQQENALRYPGIVFFLLVGTILMLVMAVQCGARARLYASTPTDVWQWWPNANNVRREEVLHELRQESTRRKIWTKRFSIMFYPGVLLLWLALGLATIPTNNTHEPAWRWAASGLAFFGAFLQAGWVIFEILPPRLSRWLYGAASSPPAEADAPPAAPSF